MNATVYNQKGEKAGTVNLPEEIFGARWNADLVHQVAMAMQSNARTPVAHTKTRGEVSGGGRKPWKQKGTGRARHGSTRSPIWKGGGITHGPRNDKSYEKKINKKMKTVALYSVLSQKFKEGHILFVDSLALSNPKTNEAKKVLTALSKIEGFDKLVSKKVNAAYIGINDVKQETVRSFRNFKNLIIEDFKAINPVDILNHKYVIISEPEQALNFLAGKRS